MVKKEVKRSFFRCQYQKGDDICVSTLVKVESGEYIPFRKMMLAILDLVMKVKAEIGLDVAKKLALIGLKVIFELLNNVDNNTITNRGSKSYYLNPVKAKNKKDASKRFDVEFWAIGGADDKGNEQVTKLIEAYKRLCREGLI